jgi:hypothetical protein
MATKSAIVAYILARWGDITSPKRVPLLDREVSNAIVDEIYPSNVTDSQTTETYTTKSGTNINYSIRITKSGNIAHIQGVVTNTTASLLSPQNAFTWKDTEFRPKSGVNDIAFKGYNGTNQVSLFINNNVLAVTSNMGALFSYSFDFKTYITQD